VIAQSSETSVLAVTVVSMAASVVASVCGLGLTFAKSVSRLGVESKD